MITLMNCAICEGKHDAMRAHCPYCGAKRVFIAHHSFEQYQIVIRARSEDNREVVRAFQTNYAHQFVAR